MTGINYKAYLSVDIGSQHTRAWLFDAIDGVYHCEATAVVKSTLLGVDDVQRGVWAAIEYLQKKSHRQLLDHQSKLILQSDTPQTGVQGIGINVSAGEPIKTVLIGLTDDASLASIRRLAAMFYCQEVALISLKNGLDVARQLEMLMALDPDLVILAGGVDGGASAPILSAVEALRLFYHLMPRISKPQIVYTGNSSLTEQVAQSLEAGQDLHLSANIIRENGKENLEIPWQAMLEAFKNIRFSQIKGLQDLESKTNARILPSAYALGRMAKYINLVTHNGKGVMAIDIGANTTTIAASKTGKLVCSTVQTSITAESIKNTSRWCAIPIEDEITSYYLQNKVIHPSYLPATLEDLAIEQSWACVRLHTSLERTGELFPDFHFTSEVGTNGFYEPIIISGSVLNKAPTLGQAFLMVLDGIQPVGITTVLLDNEQVLAALGTVGEMNALLPVQILDTDILLNLGTVISVHSTAPEGAVVVKVEIAHDDGPREICEIKQGSLKRFEMKSGTQVRLYLAPEIHADVGMGERGLGGWVSVTAGELGVIIDARGRPINLPDSTIKRSDLIKSWLWELGG